MSSGSALSIASKTERYSNAYILLLFWLFLLLWLLLLLSLVLVLLLV